ncbi:hypothetical protein [Sinorhizobium sp. BJ1]|uniref:hypothetical protein n=1 Tax=Sinorhizobium sp. BJ1 TaxID=2035455 RepID=UPI000BE824D6|nr:hypothetical protein [Sinorhizobium sp. BJ1]PDT82910.1 hypothetical protein CO676_15155 [Sinorhizobium sp. BJ1]
MTQITRRTILGGLAAAAAPLPAIAAPQPVQSPEERLHAAIDAVVDILREMNPDPDAEILRQQYPHYVFVGIKTPPKPVEWTGPGFYEVEGKHPNGNRWCTTYWLDRVDYKTVPGFYYRAERWWRGRLETTMRLLPSKIRIIRKDDDYSGGTV